MGIVAGITVRDAARMVREKDGGCKSRRYRAALRTDNVFDKTPPQPWLYGAVAFGRMFGPSVGARID